MAVEPQYGFRAQKASGLADGPSWSPSVQLATDAESRCFAYSADGQWFAHASSTGIHLLPSSASSSSASRTLPATAVFALKFSPLAKTLFSFERPGKTDGTEVHRNVRAWTVDTGEEVTGWHQKTQDDWEPIITPDESHRLIATGSDLQIFTPPLAARPSLRLKGDGAPLRGVFLSNPRAMPEGSSNAKPIKAHSEPAVALWFGEKKGAPGGVRLYPLSQLLGKATKVDGEEASSTENREFPQSLARKAFYKADKLNVKWNNAGTMALFLTHNDVDTSGKSYYGETNLYLVSLDGSYDGMVDLDKEGPIYDFTWSPTSREFTVCYGYMPARTQLFDIKNKPVHSFGHGPRNFILYQPQGKLLLSAGFGNLAGGMDIWDVSTRNKVAEFTASNSSTCEWSPCGRYILTATLSPRLRVDNGVKVWWCGGQLLHIHPVDSLYQASWRPELLENLRPFPAVIPGPPEVNESVALYRPKGEESNGVAAKPKGAYRPPGARGTLASDAYKRDENDHTASASVPAPSSTPGSGASTPAIPFRGGKPTSRYTPGLPPGAAPASPAAGAKDEKKKRVRSKRPGNKDANGHGGHDQVDDATEGVAELKVDDSAAGGGGDEATQKKIRGLNKKLKAIDELKERMNKGEVLEKTQMMKIESAGSIKAEIVALGGEA